ncbi:MAG TPA: exo-beta-N-acetylmuramidase NamZ domain-containing protein [Candidatus Acidoferrales bacterium]|nr:exo-beta-N-acetylmuramidase NamZ domain-containing protein [Candidatus Acidoferrales bacterium]
MKLFWCATIAVAALSAQDFSPAPAVDDAINQAIAQGRLPGAVLFVGHNSQVVYRKAYGRRALVPRVEDMTLDTIFDCASLTKVIATTSSLMKLFEQGKFRLNDRITDYIPEFMDGKSDITIRNLFTHFSGLQPDVPLKDPWNGYETGIKLACTFKPAGPPATRYVYSDINFILLGELVHRLSGKMLNEYARDNIFQPLGMKDTMFQPPSSLIPRIAPTERWPVKTGPPLRGIVHDPTARNMGGVAGHAGLFSTAADLSRFAQMMLNGGELDGVRLFSPLTVAKFTEPQSPPDQAILRGLGWDIDSPHSGNRGELFPIGSFGHTGFTGTSIWIDPSTRSYLILLANSVHPDQRPALTPLRGKIATIVAAGVGLTVQRVTAQTGYNEALAGPGLRRQVARNGQTLTGLDMLAAEKFAPFAGKRIGLITNQSGLSRDGRRNVDLMRDAGIQIAALFSPEHGFLGKEDRPGIQDSVDFKTDLKVFSLYGTTTRPTPDMLKGLDALVFDIQDVGVHFYTFETTMAYAMEAAATAGVPFYVLDRPNPITGTRVEGPLLDAANKSFVGYMHGEPVRHGMTMGELAKMFNGEGKLGAKLTVIAMQDWSRGDWFDSTGLSWINPSPNMRSLNAAILYPGVCFLESPRNLSVGRGTDAPFEQIGADFIGGRELAAYLNAREIPGVRVYPTAFTPAESNFKGVRIEGVRFQITNRDVLNASRLGMELMAAMEKLYPGKVDFAASRRIVGSDDLIRRLKAGEDPRALETLLQDDVEAFARKRAQYLIY